MRSSLAVVIEPLSQNTLKVPTIEDENPVQTLAPGGTNLAVGVTYSSAGRLLRVGSPDR